MSLAEREERETIIRIGAPDRTWVVWTDDKKYINKFTRAGWTPHKSTQGGGVEFIVPIKAISVRKKKSVLEPKVRNKDASFGRVV